MNSTTTVHTLQAVLPELLLIGFATAIYLLGAFFSARFRPLPIAILAIVAAGIALFAGRNQSPQILTDPGTLEITGPVIVDLFGHTARGQFSSPVCCSSCCPTVRAAHIRPLNTPARFCSSWRV